MKLRLFSTPIATSSALLVLALVTGMPPAHAALFSDEKDVGVDITMPDPPPPPPDLSHLSKFQTTTLNRNQLAYDPKSLLVVDKTGIRYTLVVTSPSGANNVSLEAFRCNTKERRTLAYGRSDGTWSPVRNSDWLPMQNSVPTTMPWYPALFAAMCDRGIAHGNPADVDRGLAFQVKAPY